MSAFDELAGLLVVRPLTERLPAPTYEGWNGSPFSASWSSTVELLNDEVSHLGARQVILEADFTDAQLRVDGMPRAKANPASDGVILTLVGTPHGDLRYPCSTYGTWQANVRAIALALEALRKIDRYGVTKLGQQYRGFRELPAGSGPTAARGREIVDAEGSLAAAQRATHPDTREGDLYTDNDFASVQAFKEAS